MLTRPEQSATIALQALVDELGAPDVAIPDNGPKPAIPRGAPTPELLATTVAAVLPDNAVIVDESVEFAALRDCVHAAAGASLRELVAFDVYRGSGIESSRKSVGLGLILQEKDRTLTDEETDRVIAAVRVALTRGFGATFRE